MQQSGSSSKRSPGLGALVWGALAGVLLIEAILDIVLLPADEVLIPAEAVFDGIYVVVLLVDAVATRPRSGREIRSTRRGILGRGLRQNRRAAHSWIGIAAVWGATVGCIVFDEWFAVHHPILSILMLGPALIFTGIVALIAVIWTIGALVSRGTRRFGQSRQVGQ